MDILEYLQNAIEEKTEIEIKYFGGSKPGSTRLILPQKIENEKLKAFCLRSRVSKSFFIKKIEVHQKGFSNKVDEKINAKVKLTKLLDIKQLLDEFKDFFERAGYVVSSDADQYIYLFEKFKNGSIKKSPTVKIYFQQYITEIDYGYYGDEFNEIQHTNEKPWAVDCKKELLRYYRIFGHAAETFYDFAIKYSPNNHGT